MININREYASLANISEDIECIIVYEKSTAPHSLRLIDRDYHIFRVPYEINLHEMVNAVVLRRIYNAYLILVRTYDIE